MTPFYILEACASLLGDNKANQENINMECPTHQSSLMAQTLRQNGDDADVPNRTPISKHFLTTATGRSKTNVASRLSVGTYPHRGDNFDWFTRNTTINTRRASRATTHGAAFAATGSSHTATATTVPPTIAAAAKGAANVVADATARMAAAAAKHISATFAARGAARTVTTGIHSCSGNACVSGNAAAHLLCHGVWFSGWFLPLFAFNALRFMECRCTSSVLPMDMLRCCVPPAMSYASWPSSDVGCSLSMRLILQ